VNIFASPAPSAAPHPDTVHDLARRLDLVLGALLLLVAARFLVLGRFTVPLWSRISRARRRLAARLARLAAGLGVSGVRAARPGRAGGPPPAYLPRRRGWLVAVLGHEAASLAAQLQALFRDPAIAAALAASPAISRALRPLCRLVGANMPPAPMASPAVVLPGVAPSAVVIPAGRLPPRHATKPSRADFDEVPPVPALRSA